MYIQYSSRRKSKFRDPRSLATSSVRGVDSASTILPPSGRVYSRSHSASRLRETPRHDAEEIGDMTP
ncbi:hypothetical protein DPMN_030767 [Dreissena polymorpha]|uniref:Uncharacterized protein n=1 Tax=Dreissena polymorpha TaxID=45954 RepID=A0A9D4LYR3_DREPO|nr:hypothetical protein DPMN_030767 [Dreissena polymorpha]